MAPGQSFHPEKCSQSNKEPHGKNKIQALSGQCGLRVKMKQVCKTLPFFAKIQNGLR